MYRSTIYLQCFDSILVLHFLAELDLEFEKILFLSLDYISWGDICKPTFSDEWNLLSSC